MCRNDRLRKSMAFLAMLWAMLVVSCSRNHEAEELSVAAKTDSLQQGCGCSLTGSYVDPVGVAPIADATSPNGVFNVVLDPIGGLTELNVKRLDTGASVYTTTVPTNAAWGFSPDGDRFMIQSAASGVVTSTVVDLAETPAVPVWTSSVATGAMALAFSPGGKYFTYSYLPADSTNFVEMGVVNSTTGTQAYQAAFTFTSPPAQNAGSSSWGFGPDDEAFVHAFVTGPESVEWRLVNVVTGQLVASTVTSSSSYWRFSPCGDRVGLVESGATLSATLYNAVTSSLEGSVAGIPLTQTYGLRATSTQHQFVAGADYVLDTNTVSTPCAATGLDSLSLSPSEVRSGGSVTGRVTLTNPAANADVQVALGSSDTALATVPASVTIPSGSNFATFTVVAGTVATAGTATITASIGQVSRTANLTVSPAERGVARLSFAPASVAGGATATGSITLSGSLGDTVVTLVSSDPTLAQVPASVMIPGGITSGTFTVATSQVLATTGVTITASSGGQTTSATLELTPAPTATNAVVDDPGCRAVTLPANDDGSTAGVTLPFNVNFFGTTYTYFYINNNGNVTFRQPLPTYTPFRITAETPPIIAPFFADVDTRAAGSNPVTYSYGPITFEGRPAICVDWVNVGYYSYHTDKLNSFQLLLVDRSDVAPGDFDIVMNYDRILWETGDASGGVGGFGGTSAGAGYSAGTGDPTQYYEFAGSLVNGALLDGNTATGLTRTSRNSLVLGRHFFEVRNGSAPVGGGITGTVHDDATPTAKLAGAPVQVCRASDGHCVFQTLTTTSGQFMATGIEDGEYTVTAYAPAGSNLNRATQQSQVTGETTAQLDITLTAQGDFPEGTGISPARQGSDGTPIVHWQDTLTLVTQSTFCTAYASAIWEIVQQGPTGPTVVRSGSFTAGSPPGMFTAMISPLYPVHGDATVRITVNCMDGSSDQFTADIYIDPSGVVQDQLGRPIPDAVVFILRARDPAGPFELVPNGSAILSPNNRENPDLTDLQGRFGWDVIAGYYVVRAQKDGCTGAEGALYAESPVLEIPPAVLNLTLTLDCPVDTSPPTSTATLSPPANQAGWHRSEVLVQLTARDNEGGSGVAAIDYTLTGAQTATGFVGGDTAVVLIEGEGETTLEYSAKDSAGNIETAQRVVVRIDRTVPAITCSTTPSSLWPPNHSLRSVHVAVGAADGGSGIGNWVLAGATSNEPDSGFAGDDVPGDIQGFSVGTPDVDGTLRAERGGTRIYSLQYQATDLAGNQSSCVATVQVPHDQGTNGR